MKKKALLSSIIVIMLCLSVIAGSTFALFTDVAGVNIAVASGKVDISATYADDMKGWSLDLNSQTGETEIAQVNGVINFTNGGTAQLTADGAVDIQKMTPGDRLAVTLDVENTSNVKIQYRVRMHTETVAGKTNLLPALTVTATMGTGTSATALSFDATTGYTDWVTVDASTNIDNIVIDVDFESTSDVIAPNDAVDTDPLYNPDNQYQDAAVKIYFTIEAVQHNGIATPTNP